MEWCRLTVEGGRQAAGRRHVPVRVSGCQTRQWRGGEGGRARLWLLLFPPPSPQVLIFLRERVSGRRLAGRKRPAAGHYYKLREQVRLEHRPPGPEGFCSCIYYQNIRCVNMDVSTQEILDEIRTSQEQGDDGNLFYLYVATPGGAPKDIHKKLIKPFLQEHGWQKVSYPNTGFRALYFCHKKSDGLEKAEAVRDRAELKNKLDEYKELNKVDFKVHMVLSIPVNYNEDFVELTSQPGSIEW
ncbi:uncharacterized protein LOC132821417 [Hemiscyllium ocellatum]|uniref:uncharacterized protein LOC132821417 n=1 Tax=Hemiscyllium ocellatum TaxID=170820 RepID=UPI002966834F|nr:uncharacterized protein LOC132821417 [Hemiscyllium ocellatum]